MRAGHGFIIFPSAGNAVRPFLGGKGVSLSAGVGGIGLVSAVYSAGYVIFYGFLSSERSNLSSRNMM